MATTLFGKKLGMTRMFTPDGRSMPVTVIEVAPNVVTQLRTAENDGYTAVQVGWGEMKARNATIPVIGHDAKAGVGPQRKHGEFHVDAAKLGEFTLGQKLTVADLGSPVFVDVIGRSKGKGFQGVMKRHHFKGMFASHGTERKHRSPGSIGGLCSNRGFGGGLKKGKRMAGHMGDERITSRSHEVVKIDAEQNLVIVKGPIPGANQGVVQVRQAVRLNRSKAKKATTAAKA